MTRLLTWMGVGDLRKLVAAGLGTAAVAATPFGLLPALQVDDLAVWGLAQAWIAAHGRLFSNAGLADYLLERFRLRLLPNPEPRSGVEGR